MVNYEYKKATLLRGANGHLAVDVASRVGGKVTCHTYANYQQNDSDTNQNHDCFLVVPI